MTKNIVICCDGTSNQISSTRTNVLKICLAIKKDPEKQIVYYHPGIGTRSPIGTNTKIGTKWNQMLALAFGVGIKADITDAYIYLMNNYNLGDRLFLFGFSRGAYTARALSGMLHLFGLAMRGNDALIPYAVEMLWRFPHALRAGRQADYFAEADLFKNAVTSSGCSPHFLGLWDTVKSVGWLSNPIVLPYTQRIYGNTVVRHAVAIDERRAFFRPNLISEKNGTNLKQVWFPGCHADVGGGLPERQGSLSNYALEWITEEAQLVGLQLDPRRLNHVLGKGHNSSLSPMPTGPTESLKGLWHLAEAIPSKGYNGHTKRMEWSLNRRRRRFMPSDACVHDVAWDIEGYASRLPESAIPLSKKTWTFLGPLPPWI